MKLQVIAIGKYEKTWVNDVFQNYAKRFTKDIKLNLKEIQTSKRTKQTSLKKLLQQEAKNILASIEPNSMTIALDIKGKLLSTEQLSTQLGSWQQQTNTINFLIGGPYGLAQECLQIANQQWSLSPLTFPHAIVRVIVAEQLYRAWSILVNHPYHRGS